jgi:hypothetical protein
MSATRTGVWLDDDLEVGQSIGIDLQLENIALPDQGEFLAARWQKWVDAEIKHCLGIPQDCTEWGYAILSFSAPAPSQESRP